MTTLTLSTGRKVSTEVIEAAALLAQEKFPCLESYQAGFDGGYLDLYAYVVPIKTHPAGDQDFAGYNLTFCEAGLSGDYGEGWTYFNIRINTVYDGWTDTAPEGEAFDQCVTHLNKVKRFFYEAIGLTEEDFSATVL